jgi:hypothetical protein
MKSVYRIGLGVVVALASAGGVLACQDDDTASNNPLPGFPPPPEMDATMASGSEPDSTTQAPEEASSPDGGSPATDAGDAGAVTCAAYCQAVMSACQGGYSQYLSTDECMTACALLPLGAAGDAMGNTVACRITHAGYAAHGVPNPHCWHAGPFGYGGCGDECDDFCLLATTFCSLDGGFDGGPPPYASTAACSTACAGFARVEDVDGGGLFTTDGGYNAAGPMSGNTLDCREWHLDNALAGPGLVGGQEQHCNHVGATSPTCN